MAVYVVSAFDVLGLIENVIVSNGKTLPYYGSLADADNYFRYRLDVDSWVNATERNKIAALAQSTRAINNLAFVGYRPEAQILEWPRTWHKISILNFGPIFSSDDFVGVNTAETIQPGYVQVEDQDRTQDGYLPTDLIPVQIVQACYENALALLNGVDPDTEADNAYKTSQGYGALRSTSSGTGIHYLHGIASPSAWRLLHIFLRTGDSTKLNRV